MLKYRLIFGTLMIIIFTGLLLLDGWLDGSISGSIENKSVQGSIVCIFICLMAIPSQVEISKLASNRGINGFLPLTIPFSILMSCGWYLDQFFTGAGNFLLNYYLILFTASVLMCFLWQAWRYGTSGTIVNCSGNIFFIFYLGFLSSFILAIRIEYGIWGLLMFIFTVKSSDIGAYTIGRLFGRHKFSPRISPGKTWEGLIGAMIFASVTSMIFSRSCGIMSLQAGVLFGALFAFAGQLGDLAESMIKRDAQQKDSSSAVPGFGGVLDIIDSPLATAGLAFLYYNFAG